MHLHNTICVSFRKWVDLINELNEEGRRQNPTASTNLLLHTQVIPSTMFDVYLVWCRILWRHFLNDWWCKVYSNGSTLPLPFSDPLPILWRPPTLTLLNCSSLCLSYREELCDLTELAETIFVHKYVELPVWYYIVLGEKTVTCIPIYSY